MFVRKADPTRWSPRCSAWCRRETGTKSTRNDFWLTILLWDSLPARLTSGSGLRRFVYRNPSSRFYIFRFHRGSAHRSSTSAGGFPAVCRLWTALAQIWPEDVTGFPSKNGHGAWRSGDFTENHCGKMNDRRPLCSQWNRVKAKAPRGTFDRRSDGLKRCTAAARQWMHTESPCNADITDFYPQTSHTCLHFRDE